MHTVLVIRLHFPLGALHVSDCISPSSGATFISCISYLVYADTSGCCVATEIPSYSHTTAGLIVPSYTKYDVQIIKLLLKMD